MGTAKNINYDGKDIWRDIQGYNGKYQVSRLGDVRRVLDNGKLEESEAGNGNI